MGDLGVETARLNAHRAVWERKPILRAIYADYYERLVARARPGRTLEVGGGSGNLKSFLPGLVSLDVIETEWSDVRADAHALPFRDASFSNVMLVDVLHHLRSPGAFLGEAARVLEPGGRLLMIEPAITPMSYPALKWLHPEPVRMSVDPFVDPHAGRHTGRAFDANQAIPTLIFGRFRGALERRVPEFQLDEVHWLSLIAYPLSGGFRPWSLVPERLVARTLRAERPLESALGRVMGFRLLVALTRRNSGGVP